MAKKSTSAGSVNITEIERAIHVVRGHRVMLDSDLARLYRVTTSALNQAVRRNLERFPSDFAYQLTTQEFAGLKSQIVISKSSVRYCSKCWSGRNHQNAASDFTATSRKRPSERGVGLP